MTPLAFWEAWDLKLLDIPKEYMVQMPEEFREVTDTLYSQVNSLHWDLYRSIEKIHDESVRVMGGCTQKEFVTFVKERYPQEFNLIMFFHKPNKEKLWRAIHQRVRPTCNILPEGMAGADRVKRVLSET